VSAAFALQFLVRARALLAAGAELEVTLALALRETAPAIASAACGSGAAVVLLGVVSAQPSAVVVLACLVPPLSAAAVLASVPWHVRRIRARFFSPRATVRQIVPTTGR